MLIKELDPPLIDTLRNLLANLMRRSSLDHIQSRPSVLSLRTRRCTNKEVVFELALQAIAFDMIRESGRDFPILLSARIYNTSYRKEHT
jgi:hypothetical protein